MTAWFVVTRSKVGTQSAIRRLLILLSSARGRPLPIHPMSRVEHQRAARGPATNCLKKISGGPKRLGSAKLHWAGFQPLAIAVVR